MKEKLLIQNQYEQQPGIFFYPIFVSEWPFTLYAAINRLSLWY